MTPPRQCPETTAFTLIELLVVITIIVILMGLAFPVFQSVQTAAKKTQAKNDLVQMVTAVNAFYTEYGKYPTSLTSDAYFGTVSESAPSGTTSAGSNDVLMDVLRYIVVNPDGSAAANATLVGSLNPRGIAFLNVGTVKNNAAPSGGVVPNGATGLPPTSKGGVWYDPWGSPYKLILDSGYDNTVTNPYSDSPGGITLSAGAVSWSWGKNGKFGGGTAAAGFTKESGSANNYASSGDIISWQ